MALYKMFSNFSRGYFFKTHVSGDIYRELMMFINKSLIVSSSIIMYL